MLTLSIPLGQGHVPATTSHRNRKLQLWFEDQPVMHEDLPEPGADMSDHPTPPTPQGNEPDHDRADGSFRDHQESYNFYREVDAHGDHLDVDWDGDGEQLYDSSGDHIMSPLMDKVQLLGVSPGEVSAYVIIWMLTGMVMVNNCMTRVVIILCYL